MANRVFVTGDVHGDSMRRLSNANFPRAKLLDRTDLVFIAGDFGSIWEDEPDKHELYTLSWLDDRPFTTMIVGGNHENWDRLRALPLVEKFGVMLGEIRPNVFFVPNGTLIEYYGRRIFCFGGAMSTDRGGLDPNAFYPEEGKGWWRGEIPTKEEMEFGIENLEKVGNQVDVIITHTMPSECVREFVAMKGYHQTREMDPTARFLSVILDRVKYHRWFCGHFHVNQSFCGGIQCLYDDILDVDKIGYYSYGRKHIDPLW